MAGAPLARSDITLSRSAMNRKRLWQRVVRVSVSDEAHCGHGVAGAVHVASYQALSMSNAVHLGDASCGPIRPASRRSRSGKVILAAGQNGAGVSRYRPSKRRGGAGTEPYAMTRKASGTDRNLTHSCSPMYSPSTWNARGRLDRSVSSV